MKEGIWPISERPRSQRTHQKVIESTDTLLREVGFLGVTIERIAEHSGVSTATLYKYWPSKNAIVAESFGRTATAALHVPLDGDPVLRLVDFAVDSLTFHSIDSGRVFFQLLAACSMEPRGAVYFQEFYLGPRRETIRPLLARAAAAGQIDPEIDVDIAMDVLFGAAIFRLMRDPEHMNRATIRETVELSVRGLTVDPGKAH